MEDIKLDAVYFVQSMCCNTAERREKFLSTLEGIETAVDAFLRFVTAHQKAKTGMFEQYAGLTDADRDYIIDELLRMNATIIH